MTMTLDAAKKIVRDQLEQRGRADAIAFVDWDYFERSFNMNQSARIKVLGEFIHEAEAKADEAKAHG